MSRDSARLRTQTLVGLVVFWGLFTIGVVLIAIDLRSGWFIMAAALGWCAASVTRALIDAHFLVDKIKQEEQR